MSIIVAVVIQSVIYKRYDKILKIFKFQSVKPHSRNVGLVSVLSKNQNKLSKYYFMFGFVSTRVFARQRTADDVEEEKIQKFQFVCQVFIKDQR